MKSLCQRGEKQGMDVQVVAWLRLTHKVPASSN